MHDKDDFILPVTTRSATNRASLDDDTSSTDMILPQGPDVHDRACDADVKVGNIQTSDPQGDKLSTIIDNTKTKTDTVDNSIIEFPMITESDYQIDDEFCNMYKYLQYEYLRVNWRTDKTTLIMAERYMIDIDDLLYRIDIPRQKIWLGSNRQ